MGPNGAGSQGEEEFGLSRRQLAALPYLIAAPTLSEGARLAQIGRTTLHRWIQDPHFQMELERRRSDAADLAKAEANGLMLKAVQVLAEALEHNSPHVRLRASQIALAFGLRVNDIKEALEKVDQIDDALHLFAKRQPFA